MLFLQYYYYMWKEKDYSDLNRSTPFQGFTLSTRDKYKGLIFLHMFLPIQTKVSLKITLFKIKCNAPSMAL